MKRVEAIISNNTNNLFEYILTKIKPNLDDMTKENIIIVPDRFSLIAEQKIFKIMGIDVYFNLSVMGISKFANLIIKKNNLEQAGCGVIESKLLTLRAIQNVKNEFKCFSKNYTMGFVDEMYAKIEQLKSSNVEISDLYDDGASIGTKLKYEDIKLIYLEYERLRGDRLDSGAVLSLFNLIAVGSDFLSKCNVFFVGFDSMTRQGIEVLKNVALFANNCIVGIVAPGDQPNRSIYDQTFLDSIIKTCKEFEIESKMEWIDLPMQNKTANFVLNNLFARKQLFAENDFFNVYKANTIKDEIEFVAKSINYNIKKNGFRYKDFAVCATDDIHEKLNLELRSLNINVFVDKKTRLSDLEPIKYILNRLKCSINLEDYENLINLVSNDFCGLNQAEREELINLIKQYSGISAIEKYNLDVLKKYEEFFKDIKDDKFNEIDYCEDHIKKIRDLLDKINFYEQINTYINIFENYGELHLQKIYTQIEAVLDGVLKSVESALFNSQLELVDLYNILLKAFNETEISGVPSEIDQVFIGNSKSFFGDVKYLYVIGFNDGVFPEILTDGGLITDKEIESSSIKAVLEPTTKVINKRNKFKMLETIITPKEKCYLCYHVASGDGRQTYPSEFITELKHLLSINEFDMQSLKLYEDNLNVEKLLFNNPNAYVANLNIKGNDDVACSVTKLALESSKQLYIKAFRKKHDVDFGALFFPNKKASVSVVEKFSSCPKANFLANGLRLKKNKKDNIEASVLGSFIHEVAELFVKNNKSRLGKMQEIEIEKQVVEICKEVLKNPYYFMIHLDKNLYIYKKLQMECKRFCEFINYEQTVSNYKPLYLEKYFGGEFGFEPIEIEVDGEKYLISGIVDRIDVNGDWFRIIDYKTGEASNLKGIENLYYGTKIQLFVYAEAIRKNINKKLFGTFYLPIKNSFSKGGKFQYSFSGFFVNNLQEAQACDSSLNLNNKSQILNCSISKKDQGLLKKKSNIFSEDELISLNKYAVEYVKMAIKNLKEGYIQCSPINGRCKACEFNQFCCNANNESVERNQTYSITNDVFEGFDYGE